MHRHREVESRHRLECQVEFPSFGVAKVLGVETLAELAWLGELYCTITSRSQRE